MKLTFTASLIACLSFGAVARADDATEDILKANGLWNIPETPETFSFPPVRMGYHAGMNACENVNDIYRQFRAGVHHDFPKPDKRAFLSKYRLYELLSARRGLAEGDCTCAVYDMSDADLEAAYQGLVDAGFEPERWALRAIDYRASDMWQEHQHTCQLELKIAGEQQGRSVTEEADFLNLSE